MSHALAGLGAAVSAYPPTTWFLTGSVLATAGALIGAVYCWRSR